MGTWPSVMHAKPNVIKKIEENSMIISRDIPNVFRLVKDIVILDRDFWSHVELETHKGGSKSYQFYSCSIFGDIDDVDNLLEFHPEKREEFPYTAKGAIPQSSGKIQPSIRDSHINWYIYDEYKNSIKNSYNIL